VSATVTSTSPVARLAAAVGESVDLRHAADVIEWDERVYMPPGGAPAHGEMSATLRRLAHEKFTSAELGNALAAAEAAAVGSDPDSDEARTIAVTRRDFDKATRVPSEFVAEHARVVSAAQHAWGEARAGSDFPAFRPHLERIIELKRQYVTFFPGSDHPYDVLIDDYEPGMKTTEVKAVFDTLRGRQVELVRRLAERPQVDDQFLRTPFDQQSLIDFSVEVITAFGFDFSRGRRQVDPPVLHVLRLGRRAHHHAIRRGISALAALRHDARDRARLIRAGRQQGLSANHARGGRVARDP